MKTETGYQISDYDWLLFSVDPVILTLKENRLCVLLVKRLSEPEAGKWSLPGGRIDRSTHKNLKDAVRQKVLAKTGLKQPFFEQVYTEGGAEMDCRGWSVSTVYMALVNYDKVSLGKTETGEAVIWQPINELDSLGELAFWHRKIIDSTLERLRSKILYSDLPMHFMPERFTLGQLRAAYELILNRKLEPSPFRRRVLSADILQETGQIEESVSNRPAALYRYKASDKVHIFKGMLKE